MAKKILIQKIKYKTGTEMTNLQELSDLLTRTLAAYVKDQSIYEDGTQSVTLELHFTPADTKKRTKENIATATE